MSLHSADSELGPIRVHSQDGFWVKYFGWIRYTTVEPMMWLYMMAYMITSVVEQAFFVHKACRVDHGFSEETCSNLTGDLKTEVQVTVSEFHQWNNTAEHLIPFILAFFFGNWSDKRGRKFPLIMGLVGKLIYSVMIVVNSMMETWNLNMIVYTASLPMGLFGADVAIFASSFAYISDVSSSQQRTLRVSILDIVYLSTMPTGIALGSYLFSHVVKSSYTLMFTINSCLLVLAIIYSFVVLKWRTTSNQAPLNGKNPIADFFDKKHVIASFKTLTRPRSGYRRLYIWILLLAMACYTFQRDEKSMSYLYTALMFSWDVTTFSTFRTFQSSLFVVTLFFAIPIMSTFLQIRDTTMVAIGALSHASGRVVFVLAGIPELFYAGTVVAALGPIVAPVIRAMASKVVPIEERGKMFALLSVCDNATPLFSGFFYSQLYNATIKTAPSSIYWLTFGTQICVLLLIMIIHGTWSHGNLDSEFADEGGFYIESPVTISTSSVSGEKDKYSTKQR